MKFFTCVSKHYRDLIPLYTFCVNRVYPKADVVIFKEPNYPSIQRFMKEVDGDYIHITDADILILPHDKTHQEYYTQYMVNGASYLRGATVSGNKTWTGDKSRICGGHISVTPEYYLRTREIRSKYLSRGFESYREFDEVLLSKILEESGYPIPDEPYTFPDGTPWDWEYRDLHLQDFASNKYLKWLPDKGKIRDLVSDPEFRAITADIDSYWRTLIHNVQEYCLG